MQRKKQVMLAIIIASLLLSLSCSLPFLTDSSTQFEDGLVQNYHPAASPVSQYTLSETQQAHVDEYGYPDRFTIFFFDEMLPDGQLYAMRHESWYYDSRGYEIVFRNGDKFTERNGAPIEIKGLGRTVYSPQGFTAEMNLDALLNLQGETGFFVQNVDDNLLKGELIFIQGLAAGFEEGYLSYVETLPLGETSSLAEMPPLVETPPLEEDVEGLTPQELVNEGRHTYENTCTFEDGAVENWSTVLSFEFVEGGVNWNYENLGTSFFYQKISTNTYEYLHEGEKNTLIFTDLGIQKESSSGSSCNSLRSDVSGADVPSDDILFQDDFSDTNSGWDRNDWDDGLTDYGEGVYQILVKVPSMDIWSNPGKHFEEDVRIDVDVTKISGEEDNNFGIICRYSSSPDGFNYYFFNISSDGFAVIGKVKNSATEYISSEKMEPSDAIKQGTETNHLQANCIGNKLTLYVNGEEVASTTDSDLTDGDIGFIAGTFEIPRTEILFDNLIVRKP